MWRAMVCAAGIPSMAPSRTDMPTTMIEFSNPSLIDGLASMMEKFSIVGVKNSFGTGVTISVRRLNAPSIVHKMGSSATKTSNERKMRESVRRIMCSTSL